ncbi:hypothetical protein Acr_02g0004390 [Actinidia rufa]|uniref:Transposase MuDR plant domain-containing protein n=1 Tax=Actinidia rufa TaxID=165716 RepID=A0A7J0E8C6_9ERIC|nr:hypothetical protein Acr_02g0004390 [Actinidia rufa]
MLLSNACCTYFFCVASDDFFTLNVEEWEWDCGTFPDITQGPYDQNVNDGGTEHVDKGGNEIENLNVDNGPGGDHESDVNYFFLDSVYDLDKEDDALFDQNVDEEIEWTGDRKVSGQGEADSTTGPEIVSDTESEDWASSDGFRSLEGSSDEEHRLTFREFKPINGSLDPVFEMIFKNRAQFVGAVRHHAILHGRDVRFKQNENTRVMAVCRKGCPSLIFATCKTGHKKTLQGKTWVP